MKYPKQTGQILENLAKLKLSNIQWEVIAVWLAQSPVWNPSVREIASKTGRSKDQVSRAILKLVNRHILILVSKPKGMNAKYELNSRLLVKDTSATPVSQSKARTEDASVATSATNTRPSHVPNRPIEGSTTSAQSPLGSSSNAGQAQAAKDVAIPLAKKNWANMVDDEGNKMPPIEPPLYDLETATFLGPKSIMDEMRSWLKKYPDGDSTPRVAKQLALFEKHFGV